jgi:colicin import membrane protein
MDNKRAGNKPRDPLNQSWGRMFAFSSLLHVVLFCFVLFVPDSMPARRIKGVVYEVNLVEMPSGKRLQKGGSAGAQAEKKRTRTRKIRPAKRISVPKKEAKPVVVAKRVVKRKSRPKKKRPTATRRLDEALKKIEKKVSKEKNDPLKQAISRLETQVKSSEAKGFSRGEAGQGISIQFYQMQVEEKIKANWSYPVDLSGSDSQKALEAIVIVKVLSNGSIQKTWFKERSSNAIFDQSVLKAVKRSDPLPPFPEGYRRTYDQIEINFNLRDLEGR